MRINIRLIGRSPLVFCNSQLADPENSFAKEIKKLNAKGESLTETDRSEIARLQWFGGLHIGIEQKVPVVPTSSLRRCFRNGAAATRDGPKVVRAVLPVELETPIIYDGPLDVRELFERKEFVYRTLCGIKNGKTRIPVTRPIFPRWAIETNFELAVDIMDFDKLSEIVQRSGTIEGLGSNHVNGYGRFSAEITKL